ncbi:hypothetical protein PGT21_010197 [Puccinia graminis f. sp. tritici]|uniref:Uncharacterized protein n=1 Tax=Puccinia graminis f. sp. tritici TaxID=56615 RepID=A0A5B0P911_PUCGR|nr:hypothetical protein PGT21_010197 [Puccinia graminis f. sp. tritici]KAA1134107.1 hypothetical protein PGTUg99_026744 [Puccinia graminis f. sp. tritici]
MTPVTEMRHGHVAFSHILRNERAPFDRPFYDDEKFSSYAASGSGEDEKYARLREVLTANEDFSVANRLMRKVFPMVSSPGLINPPHYPQR